MIKVDLYRCNGGYPESAWKDFKKKGLVTGGQWHSHQVSPRHVDHLNTTSSARTNSIIVIPVQLFLL